MSFCAKSNTLPEIVMELREQIERLLPGWKIWARLDIADFQFFGWKDNVRNCVHSECYKLTNSFSPKEIAHGMSETLEYIEQKRSGR